MCQTANLQISIWSNRVLSQNISLYILWMMGNPLVWDQNKVLMVMPRYPRDIVWAACLLSLPFPWGTALNLSCPSRWLPYQIWEKLVKMLNGKAKQWNQLVLISDTISESRQSVFFQDPCKIAVLKIYIKILRDGAKNKDLLIFCIFFILFQ